MTPYHYDIMIKKDKPQPAANETEVRKGMLKAEL